MPLAVVLQMYKTKVTDVDDLPAAETFIFNER